MRQKLSTLTGGFTCWLMLLAFIILGAGHAKAYADLPVPANGVVLDGSQYVTYKAPADGTLTIEFSKEITDWQILTTSNTVMSGWISPESSNVTATSSTFSWVLTKDRTYYLDSVWITGGGYETVYITTSFKADGEDDAEPVVTTGSENITFVQDGNKFPYTVNYSITYNANKTITVSGSYTWANGVPVGYVDGDLDVTFPVGNINFTSGGTTTETFEKGEVITITLWKACANGRVNTNIQYVVGESATVEIPEIEEPTPSENMLPLNGTFSTKSGEAWYFNPTTDGVLKINYDNSGETDPMFYIWSESENDWSQLMYSEGGWVGISFAGYYTYNITAGNKYKFEMPTGVLGALNGTFTTVWTTGEAEKEPVFITNVEPTPGTVLDYNTYNDVLIYAQKGIESYGKATFSYGDQSIELTSEYITTNGAPGSEFLQFRIVAEGVENLVAKAANAGASSFTITIEDVVAGGVEVSGITENVEGVTVENGTVSVTYLVEKAPVYLAEDSTWPETFYLSWPEGDANGIATLVFDAPIKSVDSAQVTMGPVSPGATGETEYASYTITPTVKGNEVILDFTGREFTGSSSVVTVVVNNVIGENGMPVNFGDNGVALFKQISYVSDPANAQPEIEVNAYVGVSDSDWPNGANKDMALVSTDGGQTFVGTYTIQPGQNFNIWYPANVSADDINASLMPVGPASEEEGVEVLFTSTVSTYADAANVTMDGYWTLANDVACEIEFTLDMVNRQLVLKNLTPITEPEPAELYLPIDQAFNATEGQEYLYTTDVNGKLTINYGEGVTTDVDAFYVLENGAWTLVPFTGANYVGPDFVGYYVYNVTSDQQYKFVAPQAGQYLAEFVESTVSGGGEPVEFMLTVDENGEAIALSDDPEYLTPLEPGFQYFTIFGEDVQLGEGDEYGNSPLAFINIYGINDPDKMGVGGVDTDYFKNGQFRLWDPFEIVGDYVMEFSQEGIFMINGNPSAAGKFYFTTGTAEVIPTTLFARGAFNDYNVEDAPVAWQLQETGEGTNVFVGQFEIPAGEFEFNLQTNEGMIYRYAGEGQAPGGVGDGEEERPGVMIMPVTFTNNVYEAGMEMGLGGEQNFFWYDGSWNGGLVTVTADLTAMTIKIEATENETPSTPVYLTGAEIDPEDGSTLEGLGKVEIAWDNVELDLGEDVEVGVAYPLSLDLVTIYVNDVVNDSWKTSGMTHGSLSVQTVAGTNEQGGSTGVEDTTGEGQLFYRTTLLLSTGDGGFWLKGNLRVVIAEGAVKSTTGAISPEFDLHYLVAERVPVTTFEPKDGAEFDAGNAIVTVSFGDGYETFAAQSVNENVRVFVDGSNADGDKVTEYLDEDQVYVEGGNLVFNLNSLNPGRYSLIIPAGLVLVSDGFNTYINGEMFYDFSIADVESNVQFTFVPGEGFDMSNLLVWDANAEKYIQNDIDDNKLDFTFNQYPTTLRFTIPADEETLEVGYEIEVTTEAALEEDAWAYQWMIDESTGNGVGTLKFNQEVNAEFTVAINPEGNVQPAPGLNVTLNLGHLSAESLSLISITNGLGEEIEIAGDEVMLPVAEAQVTYEVYVPLFDLSDPEPSVVAPEGVTYPEDSWWAMATPVYKADPENYDVDPDYWLIYLTLTDLLPENAELDLVAYGLEYDEGLNLNLTLDAPADFDLNNLKTYDFGKDEVLEWTLNDGQYVMNLNVENTEIKVMLNVAEGYELSVVAPEGLPEGSYKIGTQLYNPDANAEDESGNVVGGGEELEYTYVWINTEANNATFKVVVTEEAPSIELPEPDASALIQGGWFDAIQVIWWQQEGVIPYAPIEIVDASGITVEKNGVENLEFAANVVEFQESVDPPTTNYEDARLLLTLYEMQFDLGSMYTVTIPAGAVNITVDGVKVPNQEVSLTFTLEGEDIRYIDFVPTVDPYCVNYDVANVTELSTVTLNFNNYPARVNEGGNVSIRVSGADKIIDPKYISYDDNNNIIFDLSNYVTDDGQYVLLIPEKAITVNVLGDDMANSELMYTYILSQTVPTVTLAFDGNLNALEGLNVSINNTPVTVENPMEIELQGGDTYVYFSIGGSYSLEVNSDLSEDVWGYEGSLNEESDIYNGTLYLNSAAKGGELTVTILGEEITENRIYFADFDMEFNMDPEDEVTVQVPILLDVNPAFDYMGFQFDIELPFELEVASATLSAPLSGMQVDGSLIPARVEKQKNGAYRVLATNESTNWVGEIAILTISGKYVEGMAAGSYTVSISDASVIFSSDKGQDITNVNGWNGFVNITVKENLASNVDITSCELLWPSYTSRTGNIQYITEGQSVELTAELTEEDAADVLEWTATVNGQTVEGISITTYGDQNLDVVVATENLNLDTSIVVVIRAQAETEDVYAEYTLTVKPIVLGDANDNDEVNVADVVTTANYIANGNDPANIADYLVEFDHPNADVVDSGEGVPNVNGINVNDVTAIVNIALGVQDGRSIRRHVSTYRSNDRLVAARVSDNNIAVALDGQTAYAALQVEIEMPAGMSVYGVEKGARAAAHELVYGVNANGNVTVVLYSLDNSSFAAGEGSLFTLQVEGGNAEDMKLVNIFASDAQSNGYELDGLYSSEVTGIFGIEAELASGVRYFTVDGVQVTNPEKGQILIRVQNGQSTKMIVK